MSRHFFGMSPADVAMEKVGLDMELRPGSIGTIWNAMTGGLQYTDLLDIGANPTTVVTADSDGRIGLFGPDGDPWGPSSLWIDFGFGRFVMLATDLGTLVDSKIDQSGGVVNGRLDVNGGLYVNNQIVGGSNLAIVETNPRTASYALKGTSVADTSVGRVDEVDSAAAIAVTLPNETSEPNIPIGAVGSIARIGAGTVTLTAASGVTIAVPAGSSLSLRVVGSEIAWRKRAANTYWIQGDLG